MIFNHLDFFILINNFVTCGVIVSDFTIDAINDAHTITIIIISDINIFFSASDDNIISICGDIISVNERDITISFVL